MPFLDSGRRFQLIRKLGEGGMGVVYEAHDTVRDMHVALKTLRHVNPEHVFRLKREFRALCGLSHPKIINLYELSSNRDESFMTIELIEDLDILTDARHGGAPRRHSSTTSITRVRRRIAQGGDEFSISASTGLPKPPLTPQPVSEFVDLDRLLLLGTARAY